jgi:methylisocitrate lyase
MTEFGKSELLEVAALESAGVNVVIYPVTTLRLAMGAVERGLGAIAAEGTQTSVVAVMQTRSRLYELLGYAEYAAFDADVFNFTRTGSGR